MRKQICVHLETETHERLKQYARENHISSVSGAIAQLVWQAKIKNQESQNKEEK